MPTKVILLPNAQRNLVKLREFIAVHNSEAAARAARVIIEASNLLKYHPQAGRPVDDLLEYRDLVVPFGSSGYVIRYRHEGRVVYIVGIRHGKEDGYKNDKHSA